MSSNISQGIYAPLPQSLSDSDSEDVRMKEDHPENLNQILNGIGKNEKNNFKIGFSIPEHLMESNKSKPGFATMSPCRKICFISSIVLCFVTIIVFLWVLPCNEGTCPVRISKWDQTYDGIELKGKINIVQEESGRNFVLLYKGSVNSSEKGGVINVLGNNGGITWYISQTSVPVEMKCNSFDVNADGKKDCLLLGENGIEAVDPIKGNVLWYVHKNFETRLIENLDFPIVLSDLNNDGVNDLITRVKGTNKFLVVSGRSGIVLYDLVMNNCDTVQGVAFENNNFVYVCKNSSSINGSYFKITNTDLNRRVFSTNLVILPIKVNYKSRTKDYYRNNGYKLIIKNTGNCPICSSNITLIEEKTNRILKFYHYMNMYAMKPTLFSFEPTKSNLSKLKGHINGFILKLWQWPLRNKFTKKFVNIDQNMRLIKRNLPRNNLSTIKSSIFEHVVLITFTESDIHVTNSSSTEIIQLCFHEEDGGVVCQPDLSNQKDSLLVDDLDGDGLQELISFSSSFDLKTHRRLVSNIKVVCLEAELPKLYDVSK